MTHTATITDDAFDAAVRGSDRPVLVSFWATWCGPCKRLAPVVDELAGEYADRCTVLTMNVDEQPRTARDLGLLGTPTLVLFRNGVPVQSLVGAHPKRTIRTLFDPAT